MKYICELPKSEHDWILKTIKSEDGKSFVIAVNRDHPVLIIKENIAEELILKCVS